MAALISSRRRSSCVALAASSDAVSPIPGVQLAVLHVKFFSSIGSTASWPITRHKGEYPVIDLSVIPLAQSTASASSIHSSFGSSEQAVSLDSASAISQCCCIYGSSPWHMASVGIMHNLSKMMVIPYSARDARLSWRRQLSAHACIHDIQDKLRIPRI